VRPVPAVTSRRSPGDSRNKDNSNTPAFSRHHLERSETAQIILDSVVGFVNEPQTSSDKQLTWC